MHELGTGTELAPLFNCFQVARQTNRRRWLKLCGPTATIGEKSIGVLSDKRHKQHVPERESFLNKHGILRVCEFLSQRHQTQHIATSGQGHHDAVKKVDLECTLHVMSSCTELAPLFNCFKATGQTSRRTWLQLCDPTAPVGAQLGRGVKNESYRFVCPIVVFMVWISLVMETPEIVQKNKF